MSYRACYVLRRLMGLWLLSILGVQLSSAQDGRATVRRFLSDVVFVPVGDLQATEDELRRYVNLDDGRRYSLGDLERRSRDLREMLRLESSTVQVYEDGESWRVVYVLTAQPMIDSIRVSPSLVSARLLRRDYGRLSWNEHTRSLMAQEVRKMLGEKNFHQYGLSITAGEPNGNHAVVVHIDITDASRMRIARAFGPPELVEAVEGRIYNPDSVKKRVSDVLQERRSDGHFAADARYSLSPVDQDVALTFETEAWDRDFDVRFEGNYFFSARELLLAAFPDWDRPLRDIDYDQSVQRILQEYRRYGYTEAQVAVSATTEDLSLVRLKFMISEGRSRRIKKIEWIGLESEEQQQLDQLIPITDSRWLKTTSDRSTRLLESLINETRSIIVNYLLDRGYLDAEDPHITHRVEDNGYTVTVTVQKGLRYTFGPLLNSDRLPGLVAEPEFEGQDFDQNALDGWVRQVAQRLADNGYIDNTLAVEREIDRTHRRVALRMDGSAGRPYRIGAIYIKGVSVRQQDTMRRLMPMEQGDAARDHDLGEIRRRLYLLNIFREVEVRWLRRDMGAGTVDVLVTLSPKPAGEVSLGVGLNSSLAEGVSATMGLEHRNLLGNLRKFQLRGTVQYRYDSILAGVDEQFNLDRPARANVQVNYIEQWLFGSRINGRLSATLDRDAREADHDFVQLTNLAGLDFGALDAQYHFAGYSISFLDKFLIRNPALNPRDFERVGKVRYLYSVSTLDSRFDPRRGLFFQGSVAVAHQVLGSMFDFTLPQAELTWLKQLAPRLTLVVAGGAGVFVPLMDANYFPRTEKLRLGGTGTVRGYATDSIGILTDTGGFKDEFVNIGGLRSFHYQLEARVPVFASFEAVLFHDAGLVQASELDSSASGSGAAVGAGALYHTPIGPIRLDFGVKLVPNKIDISPTNIHFYIGALL